MNACLAHAKTMALVMMTSINLIVLVFMVTLETCVKQVQSLNLVCFNYLVFAFYSEIDECQSSPCMHCGVCTDGLGYFSCQCLLGYTGMTCETGMSVHSFIYNLLFLLIL